MIINPLYVIQQTEEFRNWLQSLKDDVAKARIISRIHLAEQGNFGDYKAIFVR